MRLSNEDALGTVRFSLGRTTTPNEIDVAAALVIAAVRRQRDNKK